ncbi:hypothetical protein ACUODG_007014, partial [Pseudomonas aeruginosa]
MRYTFKLLHKFDRFRIQLLESPGIPVTRLEVIRKGQNNVGGRIERARFSELIPLKPTHSPIAASCR